MWCPDGESSFWCLRQGYELKASIAFPALALFNLLRQPIRQMPECITSFINARVAAARLQEYIQVPSGPGCFMLAARKSMFAKLCACHSSGPDARRVVSGKFYHVHALR